jgi:hypothetical protein
VLPVVVAAVVVVVVDLARPFLLPSWEQWADEKG